MLIEHFLSGKLTAEEEDLLHLRREDPTFEEELLLQLDLKKASRSHERDQIKNILQREEDQIKKEHPYRQNKKFRMWIAAAAAVLLLVVLVIFLLRPRPINGERLFASYYEPYPNTISPITKSDVAGIDGYQAYEMGDFEQAISMLEGLDSDTAKFYMALAELARDNLSIAQQIFSDLQSNRNTYEVAATYYAALIAIKKNDFSTAKELLSTLIDRDHALVNRIESLLNELPE